MSSIRCCIVLGPHIDYLVLLSEIYFPDVLACHRFGIDTMSANLTILFVYCGKEERNFDFVETKLVLEHTNQAFSTLWDC